MDMFAMALGLSLLGVGVSAALFVAATRAGAARDDASSVPSRRIVADAPQFFARPAAVTVGRGPIKYIVPADVLVMQLERHVRLERAAAESFHADPTAESLHTRTVSPLAN